MKSILMSIQPKWCELIASGKKTIEVRKTAPKEVPFRAYVYCMKDGCGKIGKPYPDYKHIAIWGKSFCPPSFVEYGGKVIGEFVCDKVDKISVHYDTVYSVGNLFANKLKNMCLTVDELKEYLGAKNNGYAIGITALKIYDKPRELGELIYRCKSMKRCNNCAHYEATPEHEWLAGLCTTMGKKTLSKPPQSYMNVETPDWAKESAYKAAMEVTE